MDKKHDVDGKKYLDKTAAKTVDKALDKQVKATDSGCGSSPSAECKKAKEGDKKGDDKKKG